MKKFSIFFFIGIVCLACACCGYHRARLDNPLLANVKTIAIPYFKNKTFEPEAERIFTNAFINEFIESRKLQIAGPTEADVILYGTVRSLKEDAETYNKDDMASEYIVRMMVDVQLEERTTGKVIWSRKGLRYGEDYPVFDNEKKSEPTKRKGLHPSESTPVFTNDIQASEASKRAALQKIAADLAERVHDSIMMGF